MKQAWITGVKVMTITNLVREVGEQIVLIIPSGVETLFLHMRAYNASFYVLNGGVL